MSLRISAWLCVCLLAAGCGFQPVYGKKTETSESPALAGVHIDGDPRQYNDQLFYQALEDKLNPGGKLPAYPLYRLSYVTNMSESAIGIARDGTVSRYNVNLDATYTLFRTSDDAKITQGSLRHVSSYNNRVGAYYSTYIAKEDAIKRGMGELAEMMRARLSPFLSQENPPVMKEEGAVPATLSPQPAPFRRPEPVPQPLKNP